VLLKFKGFKMFIPFWLETNQVFKMINNIEEFNEAKNILAANGDPIEKCRANSNFKEDKPNFGFRSEHRGDLTLGAWLLLEDVKELVVKQIGLCDQSEVKIECKLVDDLGFNSLDTVELIMAIEEKWNIEIPDEDVEKIETIADVVEYITKNTGE
jgi:acyl carrier protein